MIQIYTGEGKGKTTAALGLALRAIGAEKKVVIVQFMKKGDSSELKAIKKYKLPIDVFVFGIGFYKILGDKHTEKEHRDIIDKALIKSEKLIKLNKYDIIILDEINVALSFGLLKTQRVIELLKKYHGSDDIDIVLTGRKAKKKIKELADLVTKMQKEKHYFDKGSQARKGIEY